MHITIKKDIAEHFGLAKLKSFGVNSDSWGWKQETMIALHKLTKKQLAELRKLLEDAKDKHGTRVLVRDIDTWTSALSQGAGSQYSRSVRQFESLLVTFLQTVPGHRVYKKVNEQHDTYMAYYVNEVEYHPEQGGNYKMPAHVTVKLLWEEFGGMKKETLTFWEKDCRSLRIIEAIGRMGFYAETSELREKYLKEAKRFGEVTSHIGVQYMARGTADDDVDGNPSGRDNSWYWRQSHTLQMEREGQPTRVVTDLFYEDDSTNREESKTHVSTWFWENRKHKPVLDDDETDEELSESTAEGAEEIPEIEIPIHPLVAVFDFSKHLRLRIHVNFLEPYVYDDTLGEKLILPEEVKDLVKALIEYKSSSFRDIIKGKSGGAVVLLTGPPGVGKTLTAEVYAESEHRPLYSVQCSQLGVEASDLEDNLLKVFARARRWKAVMLLDEADVYVRERGQDLQQNAIVGVFLRVMEYQPSVLFLTTNRPDDVDDAVASRCVARIDYRVPEPELQHDIWKVLARGAGIELTQKVVSDLVKVNPGITGRDIKNLLKLAQLVANGEGPITASTIEYVKRFKPTGRVKT